MTSHSQTHTLHSTMLHHLLVLRRTAKTCATKLRCSSKETIIYKQRVRCSALYWFVCWLLCLCLNEGVQARLFVLLVVRLLLRLRVLF